jgi:hypothetical protein
MVVEAATPLLRAKEVADQGRGHGEVKNVKVDEYTHRVIKMSLIKM